MLMFTLSLFEQLSKICECYVEDRLSSLKLASPTREDAPSLIKNESDCKIPTTNVVVQKKYIFAYFSATLKIHILNSLVYGIRFTVAYVLMLAAMTYNAYIFIAIVAGAVIGHFTTSRIVANSNMNYKCNKTTCECGV